jgi:hypothetical protein
MTRPPRDPSVTVHMQMDVREIAAQTTAAVAELADAGRVFVETMGKLGFPAAVHMTITRDPR